MFNTYKMTQFSSLMQTISNVPVKRLLNHKRGIFLERYFKVLQFHVIKNNIIVATFTTSSIL
mgnify:CR=1 FL=1